MRYFWWLLASCLMVSVIGFIFSVAIARVLWSYGLGLAALFLMVLILAKFGSMNDEH